MIPKIIHYCWFGRKEKPVGFYRWYETWRQYLPDYKIIEWNESNFDINFCSYTREAYMTNNFAHVSDVCRIYALNKMGGIYLDTDVEVRKSFDPYLGLSAFVSIERSIVATAVIGSRAQLPWTEVFLSYYKRTHFINICGHTVRTPNTKLLTYKVLPKVPLEDWPTVFPRDFFCGEINGGGALFATDNTVAIHHATGLWVRKKTTVQKVTSIVEGIKVRYFK